MTADSTQWELEVHSVGGLHVGRGFHARACIGKRLLRAIVTHGETGIMVANSLGFTHGTTPPLIDLQITFSQRCSLSLANWDTITMAELDATQPQSHEPVIPDMIDCFIPVSAMATASEPHPELRAWADAFATAPSNATW